MNLHPDYICLTDEEKNTFFAKMRELEIHTMEDWFDKIEPLDCHPKKEYTNNNIRLMGFFAGRYKKQKKEHPLTAEQLLDIFQITDKDIVDYRDRLKDRYTKHYQQRKPGGIPTTDQFDVGQYMNFQNRDDSLMSAMSAVKSIFTTLKQKNHRPDDCKIYGKTLLVCGGTGTGKTSFVEHFHNTWQNQEYYSSDPQSPFYAAIDRSKFLLRLRINFKLDRHVPNDQNPVVNRIIYQILQEMNKESAGGYAQFLTKYGRYLECVFLHDVLRMVYSDDEDLIFMLHIEELLHLPDVHTIHQVVDQVWFNTPHSKITIVPIVTSNNALELQRVYVDRGKPFTTVSLGLLKRHHLIEIIRGLLGNTNVVPSAMLDVMDVMGFFLIQLTIP